MFRVPTSTDTSIAERVSWSNPRLAVCLHSAHERGHRWRKICKADDTALCPWLCNARLPGKKGEEPGLWFLLEQRAEFSYNCLCSIVSITRALCTGAGPGKGDRGARWQPSLQHLVAQQGPGASEEQSLDYVRHSSPSGSRDCPWHRAGNRRSVVPTGVLQEARGPVPFVL